MRLSSVPSRWIGTPGEPILPGGFIGDRIALGERQIALGGFLVATIFGQLMGATAAGFLVDVVGWRPIRLNGMGGPRPGMDGIHLGLSVGF
jgi:hypothetical protein